MTMVTPAGGVAVAPTAVRSDTPDDPALSFADLLKAMRPLPPEAILTPIDQHEVVQCVFRDPDLLGLAGTEPVPGCNAGHRAEHPPVELGSPEDRRPGQAPAPATRAPNVQLAPDREAPNADSAASHAQPKETPAADASPFQAAPALVAAPAGHPPDSAREGRPAVLSETAPSLSQVRPVSQRGELSPELETRASVFNENGLFHSSVPPVASSGQIAETGRAAMAEQIGSEPARSPTLALAKQDVRQPFEREAMMPALETAAGVVLAPIDGPIPQRQADPALTAHGKIAVAAAGSRSAPSPVSDQAARDARVAIKSQISLASPMRSGSAIRGAAEPDRASSSVPWRRASKLPSDRGTEEGAQAQLQVGVGTEGLRILAAVARADRGERIRLRDRIAGLVFRHGLSLAELRLGGVAARPSTSDAIKDS